MKVVANLELRIDVLKRGMRYTDIAKKMGMHQSHLARMLQKEMSPTQKARVVAAMNEVDS
jgi:DNA-binding phage protein